MMDKKKLYLLMYFAGARGEKDKEELYQLLKSEDFNLEKFAKKKKMSRPVCEAVRTLFSREPLKDNFEDVFRMAWSGNFEYSRENEEKLIKDLTGDDEDGNSSPAWNKPNESSVQMAEMFKFPEI